MICTLGMHRSGTSLVSRMLNLLGVQLGPGRAGLDLAARTTRRATGSTGRSSTSTTRSWPASADAGTSRRPFPLPGRVTRAWGSPGEGPRLLAEDFADRAAVGMEGSPDLPHAALLAGPRRPHALRDVRPQPVRGGGLPRPPQRHELPRRPSGCGSLTCRPASPTRAASHACSSSTKTSSMTGRRSCGAWRLSSGDPERADDPRARGRRGRFVDDEMCHHLGSLEEVAGDGGSACRPWACTSR